jgi:hypothetical protein
MTEQNSNYISDRLLEDYERQQALMAAQPAIVQRFLETQGGLLAAAIVDGVTRVTFSLPDRVVCTLEQVEQPVLVTIPQNQRNYSAGGLLNRLRRVELYKELRHTFTQLEQSPDRSISVASGLVRHATVLHMVNQMLPAGRTVSYELEDENDTIPYRPSGGEMEPASAITSASDAIVEEAGREDAGRGDLLVPFVPYARRFYLPQWVAFDQDGKLLFKSVEKAESSIKSMQNFMEVLFTAVALAPYISVDKDYAAKRHGMLGQLVNQGRALAVFQAKTIIDHIKMRASAGSLNRGLSLSLPYFDDQELRMAVTNFEVIPAGRIMYVPAFVVRAIQQEAVKVSQDTRLNPSTRRHLLSLLSLLEEAFKAA